MKDCNRASGTPTNPADLSARFPLRATNVHQIRNSISSRSPRMGIFPPPQYGT